MKMIISAKMATTVATPMTLPMSTAFRSGSLPVASEKRLSRTRKDSPTCFLKVGENHIVPFQ
jgi:hypothetical protein